MALAARLVGPVAPRYGAPSDVARMAGLSTKTVRRLVDSGELPAYRVGRRVLVAYADADAFIRQRRVPTMATVHRPEPAPFVDPVTGRRRPLTAEEHRARSAAFRRALEVNATIRGETDTDEVWDRVERILAERP